MSNKLKKRIKLFLIFTCVMCFILIFTLFIAPNGNIIFKNHELKKSIYIALTIFIPLLLITSSILIWWLIDDKIPFKLIQSVIVIVISFYSFFRGFEKLFNFKSNQWITEKSTLINVHNKKTFKLEQLKSEYFFSSRPNKKRVIMASSFLWLFWKIEKKVSEENINQLNIKF